MPSLRRVVGIAEIVESLRLDSRSVALPGSNWVRAGRNPFLKSLADQTGVKGGLRLAINSSGAQSGMRPPP